MHVTSLSREREHPRIFASNSATNSLGSCEMWRWKRRMELNGTRNRIKMTMKTIQLRQKGDSFFNSFLVILKSFFTSSHLLPGRISTRSFLNDLRGRPMESLRCTNVAAFAIRTRVQTRTHARQNWEMINIAESREAAHTHTTHTQHIHIHMRSRIHASRDEGHSISKRRFVSVRLPTSMVIN